MTRALAKTSWVELKLFVREPVTLVFTLALPLTVLFVLGGVFGNDPTPGFYRDAGAMDFYVPAYIVVVVASMGLIGLPAHLAAYRENGVLRRFRASSVPLWSVLGAHVVVTMLVVVVGSVLLVAVAYVTYDLAAPGAPGLVVLAFLLGAVTFIALGMLLGTVLPTARAAQGAGILLWFVMLMISGSGPPPEILPRGLGVVSNLLPASHAVSLIQDPWLGFGWNVSATLVTVGFLVGAGLAAARFLRWD